MTPAPTTTSRFGTAGSDSAPVEETMRFSSTVTPGSGVDSEPVAMTMALASTSLDAPSAAVTRTLPGPAIAPVPRSQSILFFLKR